MKQKVISVTLNIILIFYFFTAFFNVIGISRNVVVISLSSFLIIWGLLNKNKKNGRDYRFDSLYYFLFCSVFVFFISLTLKDPFIVFLGWVSAILNLVVWMVVFYASKDKDNVLYKFKKVFALCVVASAVLGIYQYFVDASIFGFVQNTYGDEATMSKENVTRRVVAFMGAPQNYSVAIGIGLFVIYDVFYKSKSPLFYPFIVVAVIGGLLSGGRAFGIFLIAFAGMFFIGKKKNILSILILAVIFLGVFYFAGDFLTSSGESTSRAFNFHFDNWLALQIVMSSISTLSLFDWLFGTGFGFDVWLESNGTVALSYDFVESHVICLLLEGGLFLATAYLLPVFSSIRLGFKNKSVYTFMILCLLVDAFCTPAFSGFPVSFMAWPFIIDELCVKKRNDNK